METSLNTIYCIKNLIRSIGDDPERDGLKDTPQRMIRSWKELFSGYSLTENDVANMLTQFDTESFDEMIVLRNIRFCSFCEHHWLPFTGIAHVGYIPNDSHKVVGISKLARLVEVFSRRLQIQERICQQVTKSLMQHVQPAGAGCVLVANHSCISCRGVGKEGAEMVTSSLEGVFRTDQKVKEEFLSFIGV